MANHLAQETSPYLLQHANNPVDWHPWNAATLALAHAQNKPILLSIGYSACHWCHVMAHESFEDETVAAVMNTHFINIKVDREERPDLDHIYQNAHYLLTQRNGGWPLTLFLTPDGTPFFGGTYFPKHARYQLPGFPDLCQRVAAFYHEQPEQIATQGQHLLATLHDMAVPASAAASTLNTAPITLAIRQLKQNFDEIDGGFGRAPKFLHPAELNLLLRETNDVTAQHIVQFTLRQMACGGLYDQLGGGFCRYSVDTHWDIPHFEKMLYDNGLLLGLYSHAWQSSKNPWFAQIVQQTAGWVIREMQSPQGGYYASLDADAEHEEGKFYVWQRDQVRTLLSAEEYAVCAPYYGLDSPPNFEHAAWNLRISQSLTDIAARLHIETAQAATRLSSAQNKLFLAREQRPRPGRDEKILGSWNGLMITGMARAARIFQREDWLRSAQAAMDFIRTTLWRENRLLATYKDGKAHLNAYLDDHAFLLEAAIELLQSQFRACDLHFAKQLADILLQHFEDAEQGGFYFTSHDHETLIQRSKISSDNATPAGNGIAAQSLLHLAVLTGETRYAAAATRCLQAFHTAIQASPSYHSSLCVALAETLQPSALLVLRGKEASLWQVALQRYYLANLLVVVLPETPQELPLVLDKPQPERTTAWLCSSTQCLAPIMRLEDLLKALNL